MTIALTIVITAVAAVLLTLFAQNFFWVEKPLDYDLGETSLGDPTFKRCMDHLLGPPLLDGNRVTTLVNGDQIFPAMLAAIRAAEKSITFETYIYWSGEIGREFSEALSDRARAGVRVHVLLDWVGSAKLDVDAVNQMTEAGVEVERYHPLQWYNIARLNNRTHRKITVIDGKIGFIGGVGVADLWQGNGEDPEHWRDTHFQVEGPVVADLQSAFLDNWTRTHAAVLNKEAYFPHLEQCGDVLAQVFKSSPREGGDSARLMFLLSMAAARQRILIANSYFVPDDLCIETLVKAKRSGVNVEIIVPGKHIDTKITRRASRSRWEPLLEADIAIYEYQPTMFHCKVMVVDDCWTTVGSTNFDNRSFRLNDEANLNVLDKEFASEQAAIFERDKQRCRRITIDQWRRRPLLEKIVEWLAGLLRSQV
ncbi:MAG TPA: phospholipase D-like domain-containing protein [Lacipirellula sp.]